MIFTKDKLPIFKLKTIFIICPGLDDVPRGFESDAQQLFSVLQKKSSNNVILLKGSGNSNASEKIVPSIKKEKWLSKLLCKVTKRHSRYFQNTSFFLASLSLFVFKKPDFIYFGDPMLYRYYSLWRKISKQKFKIFFYTGGQNIPKLFNEKDMLIASTSYFYTKAKEEKIPKENIILLPIGFKIIKELTVLNAIQKNKIKEKLHIPVELPIVLSVGVLNNSIKRMNYIIDEVSKLKTAVFLILLGDEDEETDSIRSLAESKLKKDSFLITTVKRDEVSQYYSVSNIFTLASLKEGFGRVYVEALAYGMPVLAHNFEVANNVLSNYGYYGDFTKQGALGQLLENELSHQSTIEQKLERHKYAYNMYSWDVLEPTFVELFS